MKQTLAVQTDHEVLSLMTDISFSCKPYWFNHTMRDLRMDIIAPKEREGHTPCPTIIWICGGAYRVVDKSVWIPEMVYFARKGYVVACIEYRTTNEVGFPETLIDAKAAVRYLKSHAKDYAIDPKRFCIMGESAGGTLAGLVGVTADKKEFDVGDNLHMDSSVKAVVDFYGLADFTQKALNASEGMPPWTLLDFLGEGYTEEMARKASIVTYVNQHTVPFFITHGDADPTVPIEQSETLYETLQKYGVDSEYYVIRGAGHGEDIFYQQEVLDRIVNFLKRVV